MRLPDWSHRLTALFRERRQDTFEWGRNDCCLFAADAVLAMTGQDPAKELRGTYSTALKAHRILEDVGGLEALGDAYLKRLASPDLASMGDIALVTLPDGREGLAVCGGLHWHLPAMDGGLVPCPREAARVAWRVA